MTESRSGPMRGAVIRLEDVVPRTDIAGHPGCAAYQLARPPSDLSRWLHVTYDVFEAGGGIDPHYHDGLDADHAYFVIDGHVLARIGDEEIEVGPGGLMIFPCRQIHGFTVLSASGARVLRLGAAADGRTTGGSVFV